MGWAYARVHLLFTIPPAFFLHFFFRRIRSPRDVFLSTFLVSIAVAATIPWDSYLVKTKVWSYPPDAILGSTLFLIPAEELFFFVVQTYITSQLYLLLSKPVLHPIYLPRSAEGSAGNHRKARWFGLVFIGGLCVLGGVLVRDGGRGTYLGLIFAWSCPVILFHWTLASTHILSLPLTSTLLPIALPTLYLWLVDTLALRRGTWAIAHGTKLGVYVWPHLELEEALFFLVTNTMIVFGLAAGSKTFAVADVLGLSSSASAAESDGRDPSAWANLVILVRALFTPHRSWPHHRLTHIALAHDVLAKKEHGRSFLAASMLFDGRARIGLLQLYALCRICDNLVDEATTVEDSRRALDAIRAVIQSSSSEARLGEEGDAKTTAHVDSKTLASLSALHTSLAPHIPQKYLSQLLAGFESDLHFAEADRFPIASSRDLLRYAQHVAGSVAGMCVCLLWPGVGGDDTPDDDFAGDDDLDLGGGGTVRGDSVLYHAQRVGRALQLVNIARDIRVDAREGVRGRCYVPTAWLEERGVKPGEFITQLRGEDADKHKKDEDIDALVRAFQTRLVAHARAMYASSGPAIARMPPSSRPGLRAAVEQYLELGEVLMDPRNEGVVRVRVPWSRRVFVAWRAAGREGGGGGGGGGAGRAKVE